MGLPVPYLQLTFLLPPPQELHQRAGRGSIHNPVVLRPDLLLLHHHLLLLLLALHRLFPGPQPALGFAPTATSGSSGPGCGSDPSPGVLDLDGDAGRGEKEAIAAGEFLRNEGARVGGPTAQQRQQAAVLRLIPEEIVEDAERRAAGARTTGT